MKAKLFTDGGSRNNPGEAASGAFLFDTHDKLIAFSGESLGIATNNQAEYKALILGLKLARKNLIKNLECYLDSELIVKQLNGEYRVKNENIKPLFKQIEGFIDDFDEISFIHVKRELNSFADKMVNIILDTKQS